MDTIILAAGKGSRLNGITAPYMKPLLVVNGKPIIRHAIERAKQVTTGRVIVVAAPENALAITQIIVAAGLDQYVTIVLQMRPGGPGEAVLIGMRLVTSSKVLILMGDNVTSTGDIVSVIDATADDSSAVGVTANVKHDDAERFTWYHKNVGWREKINPAEENLHETELVSAWCGPICMDRATFIQALNRLHVIEEAQHPEKSIGKAFNFVHNVRLVPVSTIDIGVPEQLV